MTSEAHSSLITDHPALKSFQFIASVLLSVSFVKLLCSLVLPFNSALSVLDVKLRRSISQSGSAPTRLQRKTELDVLFYLRAEILWADCELNHHQ